MALRTPLSVTPHLYMGDSTGRPLDKGVVYFGEQDKDPEFYPINLFSDDSLTKPLAQPIHTKGGYLYDKGDMVEPHAKEIIYSVKVLDSYGRKVFYKGAMMRNSWNDDVIEQINAAIVASTDIARQVATDITNEAINNTAIEGGVLADTFVTVNNTLTQRQVNTGLNDNSAIAAISTPYEGMRVYNKETDTYFTFSASNSALVNSSSILQGIGGKWEMDTQDAYYASWFATPNVQISQTLKLQAGYDYATSKGKPFIVDDVYWLNGWEQPYLEGFSEKAGLILRSYSELVFSAKGEFKIISNKEWKYHTIVACNIRNYKVVNPKLTGDRITHDYSVGHGGEWQHGLAIYESMNGVIVNPVIEDFGGDGIYIGKVWQSEITLDYFEPTNIIISNPRIKGIRRNGISVCAWKDVYILNPVIEKCGTSDGIAGKNPASCIDVEPEWNGSVSPKTSNLVIDSAVLRDASTACIHTFITKGDLEITVHFKGITTIDTGGATVWLSQKGLNNTGLFKFDEIYIARKKVTNSNDFMMGWSGVGSLICSIDKLSNAGGDSWNTITLYPNGNYANNSIGNFHIHNIEAGSNGMLLAPRTGIDLSGHTTNNLKLAVTKDIDNTHIDRKDKMPKLGANTRIDFVEVLTYTTGSYPTVNSFKTTNIVFKTNSEVIVYTANTNMVSYTVYTLTLMPTVRTGAASLSINNLEMVDSTGAKSVYKSHMTGASVTIQKKGSVIVEKAVGTWELY